MRSRSNGGVIGAYQLPTQNSANGVFFIHDAAIYNTGSNPIWPLGTGYIYSATGGSISTDADNTNYKLHTFTANGTFSVVTGSAYIDIFLVGGGGAGGSMYASSTTYDIGGAGGGAGGAVVLATNVFVPAGKSFTVEVGQGGSATSAWSVVPTDATNSGKPSIVTDGGDYYYIAPGGGFGDCWTNGTRTHAYNGGGGSGAYSNGSLIAGTNRSAGSGHPGTITQNTASGGDSDNSYVGGIGVASGGGGAGWTSGYSGNYSADTSLSSRGGDGYYYASTGRYYGAGGPGGGTYDWPSGISNRSIGSGRYFDGRRYAGTWAYNNQASDNNGAGAGGVGVGSGVGGGGGAIGPQISGSTTATGAAGTSGTVIFRYRYK